MKDFTSIEKKLKNLNDEIENFAKSLKFQIVVQEFTFSKLTEDLITEQIKKIDFQGIYFLEIHKGSEISDFENWRQNFEKKWKKDIVKKSPLISPKRLKNNSKFIDFNTVEWLPFYIGKSQNIKKRIKEHLYSLSIESSTSALKLNHRINLHEEIFRLSIVKIDTKHYDLVMHKVEQVLRDKYNPIIGKQ